MRKPQAKLISSFFPPLFSYNTWAGLSVCVCVCVYFSIDFYAAYSKYCVYESFHRWVKILRTKSTIFHTLFRKNFHTMFQFAHCSLQWQWLWHGNGNICTVKWRWALPAIHSFVFHIPFVRIVRDTTRMCTIDVFEFPIFGFCVCFGSNSLSGHTTLSATWGCIFLFRPHFYFFGLLVDTLSETRPTRRVFEDAGYESERKIIPENMRFCVCRICVFCAYGF